MKKNSDLTKELFFEEVNTYIHDKESLALIEKAYAYVELKHIDQKRRSGEPYIVHLLNVAYEVTLLRSGPKTIAAALLHDVIEDCGIGREEFIENFDEEIYNIVEAVTKIGKLKDDFKDEKEYQAANHRKIFIAMAKDIRVIIVKLVDRLHNMRTLQYMPSEKQLRIAKETLEVYAPIAHRLGIAEIKNELEDLSFYYLNHDKYKEIAHLVENKKNERDLQVRNMIVDISKMLGDKGIKFRIFGRSKHLYSIYKKMKTKNKRFDEILDLLAIRIITESKLNCYEILGYIHAEYKPIPGRLKDYIAMPKMNMYQSLHTTIVGDEGRIFEVQIRTEEMNLIAEKGVAAHWAYKENNNYNQKTEQETIKKELGWLNAFEEGNIADTNAASYMDAVINDVFNVNIYVLTPKGRVIDLPSGSTPIDFAYRVHTEIGHQTVGSRVNDVLVPLSTILKTGDVVELLTDKKSGPSEGWIKICKTNNARNRIKSYLMHKEHEQRQTLIKNGEAIFKDELRKRNLSIDEFYDETKLEEVAKYFQLANVNDLLLKIATKSITIPTIVERLTRSKKNEMNMEQLAFTMNKARNQRKHHESKTGVVVSGVDSIKMQLSSCCQPVYGDNIVGYITKGLGVKVHRDQCPKIKDVSTRLIDVSWDQFKDGNIQFETTIKIYSSDRNFILTDLVIMISQCKGKLLKLNTTSNHEELTVTTTMTIVVEDLEHLDNLMANLRKVNNVISVERVFK